MVSAALLYREYFQKHVSAFVIVCWCRSCSFGFCWNYFVLFVANCPWSHCLARDSWARTCLPDCHKSCFELLDFCRLLNLESFCWIFDLENYLEIGRGGRWLCYFIWFSPIYVNLSPELVSKDSFFAGVNFLTLPLPAFKICHGINFYLLARAVPPSPSQYCMPICLLILWNS